MEKEKIEKVVAGQREYFRTGATLAPAVRKSLLKKLHDNICSHENEIMDALKADLGKAPFEAYATEISMVLHELKSLAKMSGQWVRPSRVRMPLVHFHSTSRIYHEPYGVVLVMSPWNYPFQLTMMPLAGAIACGNCCVVKPSEYSHHTSDIIERILKETFPEEIVCTVRGGRAENQALLEQKFDYIFFTGSPAVGRIVMEKAAAHLTPVTLELGGKSPCIVDRRCKVDLAAKRIVWGKFLNAGQTCIAPDYLYVHEEVKEELVKAMIKYIHEFYGDYPMASGYLPKIINRKHLERLSTLLEGEKILSGGYVSQKLQMIEPTLLDEVSWDSPVMQEEIFGPILPILTFRDFAEVIPVLSAKEKPLALYLFSDDKWHQKEVVRRLSFGGGCINDTIIHIANPKLPFGGVGSSGMGQYHGKYSLETFSRRKAVVRKYNYIDIFLRYPPFGNRLAFLRRLLCSLHL